MIDPEDEARWYRQARHPIKPYGRLERWADGIGRVWEALRVMGAALCFLVGFWLLLFGGLHLFMWLCRQIGWSDI